MQLSQKNLARLGWWMRRWRLSDLHSGPQGGFLRSPKRLARLAAAAFYSPELRVECAQVHMDIPIFCNISDLQCFLPMLLKLRE